MTSDPLAAHVAGPVHAVPGHGGRLGERRRAQVEAVGQRAEHARRQGHAAGERALRVRQVHGRAEVGARRREVRAIASGHGVRPSPRGQRVHRHARAGAGPLPSAAGAHHDADDLVAEHHRLAQDRRARRAVPPVVQVGAADAAVGDLDHGLVGRGRGSGSSSTRRSSAAWATTAMFWPSVLRSSRRYRRRHEPHAGDRDLDEVARRDRRLRDSAHRS